MVLSWPHNVINLNRANRPAARVQYNLALCYALTRRKTAMMLLAFLTIAGGPLLCYLSEQIGIPASWTPALTFIFGGGSFALLMKILLDTRDELKVERQRAEQRAVAEEARWEKRNQEWFALVKAQTEGQAKFLQWLEDLDEGAFCPFRGEKTEQYQAHHRKQRSGD